MSPVGSSIFMRNQTIDFTAVSAIASVQASTIHGAPSLKVAGKLLACPALHKSAEADSIVVRIAVEERELLISREPGTYYVTAHYLKYPMVLVRLSKISPASLRELLERSHAFAMLKKANPRKRRTAAASNARRKKSR